MFFLRFLILFLLKSGLNMPKMDVSSLQPRAFAAVKYTITPSRINPVRVAARCHVPDAGFGTHHLEYR